jgi:uncharacterized protein
MKKSVNAAAVTAHFLRSGVQYNKEEIVQAIEHQAKLLLAEGRLHETKGFTQHSDMSVFQHCAHVAYVSCVICVKLRLDVSWDELIRAALLHDYFLYDWHEKNAYHNLHGYTHAKRAMENARRDFKISSKEAEIIYCHMFPLNISRVPKSREARIVCVADKMVAGSETLLIMKYSSAMSGKTVTV